MWSSYSFRSPATSTDARENALLASGRPVEIKVRDLDAERPANTSSAPLSMGWLLRLFRSDFFDAFMAVTYLYRYRHSRGVHDYLCNELYQLSDADLETFMPQVCNLLVFHARDSPGLERFVLDKCAHSMHMALQVFWFLQAAVEDAATASDRDVEARVRVLRTKCETAAVNGSKHDMLAAAAKRISAATLIAVDPPFASASHISSKVLFPSSSAGELSLQHDGKRLGRVGDVGGRDTACGNGADVRLPVVEEGGETGVKGGRQADVEEGVEEVAEAINGLDLTGEGPDNDSGVDDGGEAGGDGEGNSGAAEAEGETDVIAEPHGEPRSSHFDVHGVIDPQADFDPVTLLTMKKERFDYFNDSLSIAREFVRLSLTTRDLPNEQRQAHLAQGLERINDILLRRMKGEPGVPLVEDSPVPDPTEIADLGLAAALRSVHLPLTRASSQALRILRVNSDEAVILTSRTRAPYLVYIEVLPTNMLCSDKLLFCEQRVERSAEVEGAAELEETSSLPDRNKDEAASQSDKNKTPPKGGMNDKIPVITETEPSQATSVRKLSEMTPGERQRANVRKIVYGDAYSRQPEMFSMAEEAYEKGKRIRVADTPDDKARQAVILGIYGELWSWKEERILGKSPFKHLEGAKLMPFIVKAGDDLRQEQLAIQLITQFKKIFDEEGVDVFLRPFTVMSVSSEAGFVEVIPDSVSVHSLKKRTPNFVSLLDYFERAFGDNGTRSFRAAQRRFIRSMAGYSLVTYFLQIKDRHNGNIMIDVEGRIVHIDFGFMLTNSPGAIKFENVPFKLTEEYLQVICAKKNVQDLAEASKTEGYRYFQELFVMGLLAARKHYEKITTLVEIMTEGTTMPCMTGGHSIVDSLRSRFAVGMPEEQCINFAMGLIEESRLSWRSAGYDRFQAYSNGYR
eukprot:GFKZ01010430.1.p1 GENE.GFKZ01010430.1~~GFKZ01010430.1.p1  ORF type:complete len:912 (+),score=165.91 GFKZ01010430.1:176-2911(+)